MNAENNNLPICYACPNCRRVVKELIKAQIIIQPKDEAERLMMLMLGRDSTENRYETCCEYCIESIREKYSSILKYKQCEK